VYSPRTSLTQPFMCTGLVLLELLVATAAASAGTSLSTALNVQLLCPLTASCTWLREVAKIFTAYAILRDTVAASTKERCAWDSGSVIVTDRRLPTPTRDTFQCPGTLSKKFLKLRISSQPSSHSFLCKIFQ